MSLYDFVGVAPNICGMQTAISRTFLRYTAIIIAANTLLRGVLTRMDGYKWMIVSATAFVAVISYFIAISVKDAFVAYADPVPQNLEILLALQEGGFDGAPEAPPSPDSQPFSLGICAAGNIILRCLIRTVDAVNRV